MESLVMEQMNAENTLSILMVELCFTSDVLNSFFLDGWPNELWES